MRSLDFLCAFLDFFERQRIIQAPPSWRRGLFYFAVNTRQIVGASSARPWELASTQNCTGGYSIRPYALQNIAISLLRRGAFHMLPCGLAPTPNCAGEQCSPVQSQLVLNNS